MAQMDVIRGRALVERWCGLAEQRLEYLTELFETGRWRRYFGEVAFLENIQEAKRSVKTWRTLLEREALSDNRPTDLAWLGRRPGSPQPRISLADELARRSQINVPPQVPVALISAPETTLVPEPPVEAAEPAAWIQALTPTMQQRYPELRATL